MNIFEPWLPQLIFIETEKSEDNPNYINIGFDKLDVPEDCTYVLERFTNLTTRFNEKYWFRKINSETLVQWQIRLQVKFDAIVHKYDRAYGIYALHAEEIKDVTEGQKATSIKKLIDTPDALINDDNEYAGSYEKIESEVGLTGKSTLENANENIETWKDLDTAFISEFENNFLNVFNY